MTPEEIAYDLAYYGEDLHGTFRVLVETIARLPDDVATFALGRCCYVSVGEAAYGMVLPGRIGVDHLSRRSADRWIVVLAEAPMAQPGAHGIVAHEIAHAWRRDDRLGQPPADCERATAELTAQWGFDGIGAD